MDMAEQPSRIDAEQGRPHEAKANKGSPRKPESPPSGPDVGMFGQFVSGGSQWVNDHYKTLRRAALAAAVVGTGVALFFSPGVRSAGFSA